GLCDPGYGHKHHRVSSSRLPVRGGGAGYQRHWPPGTLLRPHHQHGEPHAPDPVTGVRAAWPHGRRLTRLRTLLSRDQLSLGADTLLGVCFAGPRVGGTPWHVLTAWPAAGAVHRWLHQAVRDGAWSSTRARDGSSLPRARDGRTTWRRAVEYAGKR